MLIGKDQVLTLSNEDRILTVSILIAARDEENNIANCLKSLLEQIYPAKFEILVGDDSSTDQTADIIQDFCLRDGRISYYLVSEKIESLKGKQNVLAQIADFASGEILVITDADVVQHPLWLNQIVATFSTQKQISKSSTKIGIITGPTIVHNRDINSALQAIDWLVGVSVIKAMSVVGLPITAIGNNMAISKSAYEDVGTYKKIPFSITEDYKLFSVVLKKGYSYKWIFNGISANTSESIKGFWNLAEQRKRWILGGSEGPWYALALYGFYLLALPFFWIGLIISLISNSFHFEIILIICFKCISDILCIFTAGKIAKRKYLWLLYPIYIGYSLVCALALLYKLISDKKITWKGRTY